MNRAEKFTNISVLGAAGKMGSGILLLNTLYISELAFNAENRNRVFVINAIDQSDEALKKLLKYIRSQLLKHAEKNINQLRLYYAHREELIENSDIIPQYINDVVEMIRPSTNIEAAYSSYLVFEAVTENIEVKSQLLSRINQNSIAEPLFFTNTSSIPIKTINKQAKLNGNIIGCHFYNPPAVQKLIELIRIEGGNPELADIVNDMAAVLCKVIVPANDIAGFIGNGVFIREIIAALKFLQELREEYSFAESIAIIDTVTRDLLLRPMGIFQLIDYVGINVCHFIVGIIAFDLDEQMDDGVLKKMLNLKIEGGQNADGAQKDGFFRYEKGKAGWIYDLDSEAYIKWEETECTLAVYVGEIPFNFTWKNLIRDKDKVKKIGDYFNQLRNTKSEGAVLAGKYLDELKKAGQAIIDTNVSDKPDDINLVMVTGFHQLYGPINNY